jgi:hypothetical protein
VRWLDQKPAADEIRALVGRVIVVVQRVNPLQLATGTLISVAAGDEPDLTVEIAGRPFRCPLKSVVDLAA